VQVESKEIRLLSIIHNGIILDLVCGFGLVVLGMCVLIFSVSERKPLPFYGGGHSARSGEPA